MKLPLSRVLARVVSLFFRADQDELPIEECVDMLYLRYITLLNNVFNLSPFFFRRQSTEMYLRPVILCCFIVGFIHNSQGEFNVQCKQRIFSRFRHSLCLWKCWITWEVFFCSWFHIQWDRIVLAVKENGKLMNETTRGNHRLWGCIRPSPL